MRQFLNAVLAAALCLAPAVARAEGIAAPSTAADPLAAFTGAAPATTPAAGTTTAAAAGAVALATPPLSEYDDARVGLLAPPLSDAKPVPVVAKGPAQLPESLGAMPGVFEIPGAPKQQVVDDTALTFEQVMSAYTQGKYDIVLKSVTGLADARQHDAEQLLGLMYMNGQGVEKDQKKAFDLLFRAAEGGKTLSQHYVAVMYFTANGVEEADSVRALMWITIAILHYADGPDKDRAKTDRDTIYLKMSRVEKSRAQQMARDWLDKQGEGHLMDMQE